MIGLAGKPGSGKSAVARELARRPGVEWIDLDRLAWETYLPGTKTHRELVERFGPCILRSDGAIDRRKLATRALADARHRADLDAIVHPAVMQRLRGEIRGREAHDVGVLLVEGALLLHSPHVDRSVFDLLVWLDASDATRAQRLERQGRGGHRSRVSDVDPSADVVRVSAEGAIDDVAARLLAVIDQMG